MSPSYSSTMHLLPGPLSGSLWRLSCRSHSLYSGHPVTNFMRLAAICTKRSFTLSLFAASDRRHDYLSRVHDDPLTDLLGATSHNIKGVDSCRFASLTLYHIFLYPLHILFVDEIMLDALKISTFLVALSSTRLALAQDFSSSTSSTFPATATSSSASSDVFTSPGASSTSTTVVEVSSTSSTPVIVSVTSSSPSTISSVPIVSCIVLVSGTPAATTVETLPSQSASFSSNFSGATGTVSSASVFFGTTPTFSQFPNATGATTSFAASNTSSSFTEVLLASPSTTSSASSEPASFLTSPPISRPLTTSISATLVTTTGNVTTVFPSSLSSVPTGLPICGQQQSSNTTSTGSPTPSDTGAPGNGSAQDQNNNTNNNAGFKTKHNVGVAVIGAVAGAALLAL
ncbi:hypothetical protein CVT26_014189 [Gymnopilus dilepis]|uniref:Uncharacterized protein n=1 Tax=Gymnopilus dilepis TaxID=231916 RepID=A0A409VXE8_9AGAR|nr:hypothetical protein CVT26_014189 [Gymnopilus dilepis]